MRTVTLQERVEELVEKHGGLRAAGRAIGVEPAYLCRLRAGMHILPQRETLRRLGLRVNFTVEE